MNAVGLPEGVTKVSPRLMARVTGAVYLLFFVTAVLGEVFVRQAGVSSISALPGDAAATAHGILAHEDAYRVGWALGLISTALYIAVIALFYQLFRAISRSVAFVATSFGLVAQAITAVGSLFPLAALVVVGGSPYLNVFDAKQLQALALLSLNLNAQLGNIALIFAGPFQLLIGYLIFRSTFLPRILAAPIALAGLGWLTFLWPPLANHLLSYVEVLGFLAELALMFWLLLMGVNAERWIEQAGGNS